MSYLAPGVAQYSLGLQHQLAPALILITQYVGNTAYNQNINRNINTFPLSTPLQIRADQGDPGNKFSPTSNNTSLPNPNIYRIYQGYTGIKQQENTTRGTYNSYQMGLRAQNKHGLSGEVDYTWSHEIDVTSYDLGNVSNPFNVNYDRGSGALDRRHMVSVNYIYQLPAFSSTNGFLHQAIGGWEVSGTMALVSGALIRIKGRRSASITTRLASTATEAPTQTGQIVSAM